MLNMLRRRGRRDHIMPMRSDGMSTMPGGIELAVPPDDYHVEGETVTVQPTTATRVVHGLQLALIVILAVLSFAIFWLIGLMLDIL
jgi:hypothetical protein